MGSVGARWPSVGGRLEAVLLLLLGVAAFALARSERYGTLMNTSFRWVTIAGAVLLTAMALALLHRPRARPTASAILIFLTFFALILVARPVRDGTAVLGPAVPSAAVLEREGYEIFDPEQIFQGLQVENPGLAGRQSIMGGLVKRTEALDAEGRYVLLDPVMACCLADAIGLGVVVDLQGKPAPTDAEWVYVYGLLDTAEKPLDVPPLRTGTIMFTAVSKQYVLRTHDLVTHRALQADVVEKLPEAQCARFAAALEASGVAEVLRTEGPFTLFAPLDLSFADTVEGAEDLRRYLEGFVVRGRLDRRDLHALDDVETLSGRRLPVRTLNGRLSIDGSRILFTDAMARNGVVHLVHPAWGAATE